MHVLQEKTSNKTIVECANDRLWGTGKALADESCLNRDLWISQGILGQILESIRTEFASCRTLATTNSLLNGFPRGDEGSSLYSSSSAYNPNTNPMHTLAMQPAAFYPTQIPVRTTTSDAQSAPSVTTPVADQSAQPHTNQPLSTNESVHPPDKINNSASHQPLNGSNKGQLEATGMELEQNGIGTTMMAAV